MPADRVIARRRAIGDQTRAARLHANLSHEQVALRDGIRIATYSNVEQAHVAAKLDTLHRIADAIGVPLADLVQERAPAGLRRGTRAERGGRGERQGFDGTGKIRPGLGAGGLRDGGSCVRFHAATSSAYRGSIRPRCARSCGR
ncbi:helix-turn-helix transcriptional regulator [Streptomyces sp. NPDC048389]|uniref:helix-turn-helix domain-containing protein n=1 Tax=Streptomyces sp. NPDC048389 TaxID=3154622 RepID=UPI003454E153